MSSMIKIFAFSFIKFYDNCYFISFFLCRIFHGLCCEDFSLYWAIEITVKCNTFANEMRKLVNKFMILPEQTLIKTYRIQHCLPSNLSAFMLLNIKIYPSICSIKSFSAILIDMYILHSHALRFSFYTSQHHDYDFDKKRYRFQISSWQ